MQDPDGGERSRRGDELLIGVRWNQVLSVQVSTAGGFHQIGTIRLSQLRQGEAPVATADQDRKLLNGTLKALASLSRLEVVLGWRELVERKWRDRRVHRRAFSPVHRLVTS